MIGIIGYGFVGKAVANGFPHTKQIIKDPAYNDITISDIIASIPEAIFVCLPTPTDDSDYHLLKSTLKEINDLDYNGIVVVKSTILPHYLKDFDVVLNPEFLSRGTANEDFINPPFVLIGGDKNKTEKLLNIYEKYSCVNLDKVFLTDLKTASLYKYMVNSFYATKVTFFNEIYEVCQKIGVDYEELKDIMFHNPWIANQHVTVPGHEGRGFSGPCLPKDTEALVKEYNVELLKAVLEINSGYCNAKK